MLLQLGRLGLSSSTPLVQLMGSVAGDAAPRWRGLDLQQPRRMSYLVYNRLPPAPQVDTSARGSFRGVFPNTEIVASDTPAEAELKKILRDSLPSWRFKEAEPGVFVLPVSLRSGRGKKAAKQLRRQNEIPAILFGGDPREQPPELLKIKTGYVISLLATRGLMGYDYVLDIPEQNRQIRVTPHVCQFDSVTDVPINITFYRWKEPKTPLPDLTAHQRYPENAYKASRTMTRAWMKKSPRVPTTYRHPIGPTFATRARREKRKSTKVAMVGHFNMTPQSETRLQIAEQE